MERIEVVPERMTYGGAALARHEGRVIFVPFALPGERVLVEIRRSRKRWAEAELVTVLEASPDRIEPRCPHFGPHKCGGCQWQHISYNAQLRYKEEIVREQFRRLGKVEDPPVEPCLGMEEPWYYRNNVQLRLTAEGPGFVREDNRGIYPIDRCFIMNDAIYPLFLSVVGKALPGVERIRLRGSERSGERLAVVKGRGDAAPVEGLAPIAREDGRDVSSSLYHEVLGGERWQVRAGSFFQVNTEQAERLLAVVGGMAGPLAPGTVLVDAYAGVGLFGLSLAGEATRTFLVESHPAAAADARQHAAGRGDVTVIEAPVEEVLAGWEERWPLPDLVLLDPPRAGCTPTVLEALGNMRVPIIIYVSCDPATQARDVRRLLEAGFRLDRVQPVDMFPQTYHIESVARLHFAE